MTEDEKKLEDLRVQMDKVNEALVKNLNEFFRTSNRIGKKKDEMGLPHFDPVREFEMLKDVQLMNKGPMPQDQMKRIFKEIFKASVEEMGAEAKRKLKVNRLPGGKNLVVVVNGIEIGGRNPVVISGPCSVEDHNQLYITAKKLHELGVRILRGGAFKPRTSPYGFQGLEEKALKILRAVADEFNMAVITEVLDTRNVSLVEQYSDILQVGTRNMLNYSLLKALGKIRKPILLKRGLMATIDEFILAAEYIYLGGNEQVILCERGIRTFETQTRNTLDISCIPILKKETPLPIIVDISHSIGRKDIIKPIARAALAAGADGLMFESHYNPTIALSDSEQQLDLEETQQLIGYLNSLH
ncbi:MAG: bifunctional 3-deoxy-7-phosphoheptulonate synthase/chorismate mutase [Thermodesulfobacteriota bacterium]|nr:bifunctional 3-deoxy-7-phosphoheptulonate synthase/chorismate mutase [Thermodesulfobacteriota bacterium]